MKITLCFVTLTLALFLSCGEDPVVDVPDPGQPTITSGITGTIHFTGQWPATASEIRLVTSKKFPPEMSDIIYGTTLIPADATMYDYEFALEPGIYKFVGVAWKNEGVDWNFPSICSFHFSKDDSLAPIPITVENATSIVKKADIAVDRAKANIVSAAKITGNITFNGVWPDSITEARVIATTRFDLQTLDLPTANDLAFSTTIAKGSTSCVYNIPAFPGDFKATFIIFFSESGKISEQSIFDSADRGGLDIGTHYTVAVNAAVTGPDFTIQF